MNLIGEMVGNYKIEKLIGHGTMAEVYLATHVEKGYSAAIKVIHRHLLNDASFMERFRREARILTDLDHPHITHIYEYNFQPDQAYIVMEYLGGGTLGDRLKSYHDRKERMPLLEVLQIIEPIASAVDYAHEHGLVHRDLKPANILFREKNDSVLTDFGLAYMMNDPRISTSNTITGTPAYLSPEQAKGMPGDGRSDVYALGIILYEMLSGYTPYQGNVVTIVMKHISETPPSIRSFGRYLPKKVEEVVFKALEKQSHNRYQSAQILVRDLRKAIEKTIPEALAQEEILEAESEKIAGEKAQEGDPNDASLPELAQNGEEAGGEEETTQAAEDADVEAVVEEESDDTAGKPHPQPFQRNYERLNPYDTLEIPRRARRKKSNSGMILTAILGLLVVVLAILYFVLPQVLQDMQNQSTLAAGTPKFTIGQSVTITIPGGARTSLYDGCRSVMSGKVVGMAADGQKAQIKTRRVCGEEWYYQVLIKEAVSKDWDGIGYLSGEFIK